MKSEIKKEFRRLELADHLEKIARQLRSGTFDTEGRQWSIPDTFEARIKQLDDVEHELRDLRTRWVACHRDFK